MRVNLIALVGAFSVLIDAQNASSKESVHVENIQYLKPGAAITLSHDYDGKTSLGELETLTASLSHIYQIGTLSVQLFVPSDIVVSAFTPLENHPLSNDSTVEFPIQFSALKRGFYTLSLEMIYRHPDGHESRRVLSIPINAGGEVFEKGFNSDRTDKKTVSRRGLVGLTAIEVIE